MQQYQESGKHTTVDDESHPQPEASRALVKSGLRGIEGTRKAIVKA